MRRTLEAIALVALVLIWGFTWVALKGPNPLPDRIATHFDFAGNANGWGEPSMLWLFPIVASFIYGMMMVVVRYPASFHYSVGVTDENRPRLQAIAVDLVVWLKAELVCLFAWIQYEIIESARLGKGALPPILVPIVIVGIFATIIWYFIAMQRVGRTG
jgi:uncharacterized membrane protein